MIQVRPYKIKNTAWRRVCLVIGITAAALWVAPVAVLTMPFRIAWNMAKQAWWAACDEWSATWDEYSLRLLRTGFWWAWQPDFQTDSDAALKRAKARVERNRP